MSERVCTVVYAVQMTQVVDFYATTRVVFLLVEQALIDKQCAKQCSLMYKQFMFVLQRSTTMDIFTNSRNVFMLKNACQTSFMTSDTSGGSSDSSDSSNSSNSSNSSSSTTISTSRTMSSKSSMSCKSCMSSDNSSSSTSSSSIDNT